MSKVTRIHVIDAGHSKEAPFDPPEPGKTIPLIPDDGEYAVALARMADLGAMGPAGDPVPCEVFLHLYAYELLERMREQEAAQAAKLEFLILPFWPEALFEAAGLPVSGVREIQGLFSKVKKTYYVKQPEEVLKREARCVLGRVRFDFEEYLANMNRLARDRGWELLEA
ncbi:MAG: hypothetical protein ACYTG7_02605 [Planctomycetota bacterium]|jgi:hypothetical protein